jgi:hypothetical protein
MMGVMDVSWLFFFCESQSRLSMWDLEQPIVVRRSPRFCLVAKADVHISSLFL